MGSASASTGTVNGTGMLQKEEKDQQQQQSNALMRCQAVGNDPRSVYNNERAPFAAACSFVSDKGSTTGSRRSNVYTTTGSSQRRRQSIPVDPAAKMTRDTIKREESFLLNAWTSDKFQGAGVALAVLVLLVVLLAAGPPPTDARCTLPWC